MILQVQGGPLVVIKPRMNGLINGLLGYWGYSTPLIGVMGPPCRYLPSTGHQGAPELDIKFLKMAGTKLRGARKFWENKMEGKN